MIKRISALQYQFMNNVTGTFYMESQLYNLGWLNYLYPRPYSVGGRNDYLTLHTSTRMYARSLRMTCGTRTQKYAVR